MDRMSEFVGKHKRKFGVRRIRLANKTVSVLVKCTVKKYDFLLAALLSIVTSSVRATGITLATAEEWEGRQNLSSSFLQRSRRPNNSIALPFIPATLPIFKGNFWVRVGAGRG